MDTIAQAGRAPELRRLREALVEHTAVRLDHALRGDVRGIRRDLDEAEPLRARVRQHVAQCLRRVAAALLRGQHRVADVTEARWRQRLGARLPAKADRAAEFAVPHPHPEPGYARDERAIGKP